MNEQGSQRRVVIIGGGFAGLFAARVLRRAPVPLLVVRAAAPARSKRRPLAAKRR